MNAHDAVRAAFAVFIGRYGARKWDIPAEAARGWAASFEADGVTPQEIMTAANVWSSVHVWPPSYAELRGSLPRFCRCMKCHACHQRALERACRAVRQGSAGAQDFSAPMLSDIVASSLPNGARPQIEAPRARDVESVT